MAANQFEQRLRQLEVLIGHVEENGDDETRRPAVEAIQALLQLHGDGLERMLAYIEQAGQVGDALLADMARDEVVSGLLLLHGLHPIDLEARVRQALDKVRPYLAVHGADVEVVRIDEGGVGLQLRGLYGGAPSSPTTLRYAIEQAILEAAPDITSIHVAGLTQPAQVAFMPLSQINAGRGGPEAPVLPLSDRPAAAR